MAKIILEDSKKSEGVRNGGLFYGGSDAELIKLLVSVMSADQEFEKIVRKSVGIFGLGKANGIKFARNVQASYGDKASERQKEFHNDNLDG